MIRLRQMAAAFLFNGDDVLLMKRADTRELAPGLWAPVGGHLEPAELNDPAAACLREIYEETGLDRMALADFELRYLINRLKGEEIRLQYIYFGRARTREVVTTREGELHWIPQELIFRRELAVVSRLLLEHYFSVGRFERKIYVGTMSAAGREPKADWAELADWE
jgi:8-oxo-dGTP diphosphatase